MDPTDDHLDEQPSSPAGENPMAYLGLRRRNAGDTDSDATPVKKEPGIALNRRGIPARKRKKNSLIYGADDVVSIPVKSPKKRAPKTERSKSESSPAKSTGLDRRLGSPTPPSSPTKRARVADKKKATPKKNDKSTKIKIGDKRKSPSKKKVTVKPKAKKDVAKAKPSKDKFSEDDDVDNDNDVDDDEVGDEFGEDESDDEEDFDLVAQLLEVMPFIVPSYLNSLYSPKCQSTSQGHYHDAIGLRSVECQHCFSFP